MSYSFGIGKVTIKNGATVVKEVIPLQDVSVDYSLSVHEEVNAEGAVISEAEEKKSITISFSYATNSTDISLIDNTYYDLVFEANDGRGLAVTLASCKLTGYSLKETQDNFVIITITFTKIGDIDSSPGETPASQKVKFGSVYIGDSASISTSYRGNAKSLIIPTLLGVLLRSTSELGGGQLEITVSGYKKCNTRLELEQYLINLYTTLATGSGTLTVEYGGSSYTITNCYWSDGSPERSNKSYSNFELTFIKSAY